MIYLAFSYIALGMSQEGPKLMLVVEMFGLGSKPSSHSHIIEMKA